MLRNDKNLMLRNVWFWKFQTSLFDDYYTCEWRFEYLKSVSEMFIEVVDCVEVIHGGSL